MEINGNTLFFILFFIFFLISSPKNPDGTTSQYESKQLKRIRDQLGYEFEYMKNNMTFNSLVGNITGFRYSYNDMALNHKDYKTYFHNDKNSVDNGDKNKDDKVIGFPLPGKDYTSGWKAFSSDSQILPQYILDKVKNSIWQDDKDDTSDGEYPWNISSYLRGSLNLESHDEQNTIHMPVPKYFQGTKNNFDYLDDTDAGDGSINDDLALILDTPPYGDFFMNDTTLFEEKLKKRLNVSSVSNKSKLTFSIDQLFTFNDRWKFLNLNCRLDSYFRDTLIFKGLYDKKYGKLFIYTQSAKFHPLFVLPHYYLGCSETEFNELKKFVEYHWNETDYLTSFKMNDFKNWYKRSMETCEFVGFFQLEKWDGYDSAKSELLEKELQNPTGRPINVKKTPLLNVSKGILYSPDCGDYYNLGELMGERKEIFQIKTRHDLLIFFMIPFVLEIYFFLVQMVFTNTPSKTNKISRTMIDIINMTDGAFAFLFILGTVITQALFTIDILISFLISVLAFIFEYMYMCCIIMSQSTERRISWVRIITRWLRRRRESSGTSNGSGVETTNDNDTDPPLIIPDEQATQLSVRKRSLIKLVILLMVMLPIFTKSYDTRKVFEYVGVTLANSYMVPQILKNCVASVNNNNVVASLNNSVSSPDQYPFNFFYFIVGFSLARLIPYYYLYGVASNSFYHHTNYKYLFILTGWVVFQIIVLYIQKRYGGNSIIPKFIVKKLDKILDIGKLYDYHHKLSRQVFEENGRVFECPICMNEDDPIIMPVEMEQEDNNPAINREQQEGGEDNDADGNENTPLSSTSKCKSGSIATDSTNVTTDIQDYMITPCDHVFHSKCLITWMNRKLQCPVCRAPLPPL
ncbi:uncharacterized protein SCODWIG_02568 [Saccharomycodes ludwigii]|uniref:RING-type E3 ubiquitin transferase n=1 Tax=Saccharomycodes ludwigii TaxID=36035 RepID=A0A376B7Z4_9ASCO|nr:hypothetical protein SCDLUD_005246 [Saccharomycodes ludwigii]KAH3898903.1 hypothetical protein SCDLUD_005246 [Saccharomycodes ludwigii]SSD60807.1 uncharacterized protein SCODWIG_02568 [Saccharomycodes ludwigii]